MEEKSLAKKTTWVEVPGRKQKRREREVCEAVNLEKQAGAYYCFIFNF